MVVVTHHPPLYHPVNQYHPPQVLRVKGGGRKADAHTTPASEGVLNIPPGYGGGRGRINGDASNLYLLLYSPKSRFRGQALLIIRLIRP